MEREYGALWNAKDHVDGLIEADDPLAVRDACTRLLELLEKHTDMEKKVIYPQADELLTSSAGAALGEYMESGSMPADWAAHSARK